MLSKKFSCNWFSFGIWRKQTFRYWPIWASYLAIWLLTAPQMLDSYYYENTTGLDANTFFFGRDLIQSLMPVCALMAVYACFIAVAVYSYLYQSRSVNLFHALPVRRETLFATNFITGLSFLVGPNLILTLYFGLLQIIQGATGDFVPLLTWFAVTTLMAVFFFGLATLCAMATATIFMLPVLYGIFNFLVVVVETVVRWLASMFLWGVTGGYVQYQKWSPLAYLFGNGFENNRAECIEYSNSSISGMYIKSYVRFEDWGYVLLLALAGLAFAGFALWLYRRWQSESAGDLIAFSFLRPVFTYVWAAGCSLMLGSLLFILLGEGSILGAIFGYDGMDNGSSGTAGNIIFVLCMLAGGTVGYFAAQMLHKKSFRVFAKKDLKGYGAFVLALLAVVLCIKVDLFGIESWTPDADEVKAVWVAGDKVMPVGDADTKERIQQVINIHKTILAQRETLEEQLDWYVDYENAYIQSLTLRYELKSGRQVTRQYYLRVDRELLKDPTMPVGMLYAFTEDREQRLERSGLGAFGTLKDAKLYISYTPKDPDVYEEATFYVSEALPEHMSTLMDALYKDVEEGTIGAGDLFDRLYWNNKHEQEIRAELSITDRNGKMLEFYITEENPNTLAWVKTVLAEYLAKQETQKPTLDDTIAGVQ